MKLKFTKELPKKEGFYWWTNFGEHTPCVMQVTKDYSSGGLYADNGEYSFPIGKKRARSEDTDEDSIRERDGSDVYRFGDELWCYIPTPFLPKGKKQVTPDCY